MEEKKKQTESENGKSVGQNGELGLSKRTTKTNRFATATKNN